MRKTYSDGSVVEGTPDEVAEFDRKRPQPYSFPVVSPMQQTLEPTWKNLVWTQPEECAVQRFSKENPGAQSVNMACFCRKCSTWCMSVTGSATGPVK